jgi:hypothetical protein
MIKRLMSAMNQSIRANKELEKAKAALSLNEIEERRREGKR